VRANGVAIGVVLAPIALRLTSGLLFGVGPFNPETLLSVVALLTAVSIAASTIPALRAARLASVSFKVSGGAPDRVHVESRRTARRGFPVEEISRSEGDAAHPATRIALLELSEATLDPSRFNVPAGYRRALPRLTGGFEMTKPDTLPNRLEDYWEVLALWARSVFRF